MEKPTLKEPLMSLQGDLITTFLAGHKEWRPDLDYPQSYSDMQAGMMAILRMFEIKRRPVAIDLPLHCQTCNDTQEIRVYEATTDAANMTKTVQSIRACPDCPKTYPKR